MRGLFLLAMIGLMLIGCTTGHPMGECPAPKEYTEAQQAQAAKELQALAPDSMIAQFVVDYSRERAILRACKRAGG